MDTVSLSPSAASKEAKGRARTPRTPAAIVTSYTRMDRPLSRSGIFRMPDPAVRKREQTQLEAILQHGVMPPAAAISVRSADAVTTGSMASVDHDGRRYLVDSTYTLGPEELITLLAVCALTGMAYHGKAKYEAVRQKAKRHIVERLIQADLLDGLERDNAANQLGGTGDEWRAGDYLRIKTTVHTLLRECGLATGGSSYWRMVASLIRLSRVAYCDLGAIGGNRTRIRTGEQLLRVSIPEAGEGEEGITLVLNSKLTQIVLRQGADADGFFVDMGEVRRLRDGARIVHFRLSARVTAGSAQTIPVTELVEWAYGPSPCSPSAACNRRKRAAASLMQVGTLPGWIVGEATAYSKAYKTPPEGDAFCVYRLHTGETKEALDNRIPLRAFTATTNRG